MSAERESTHQFTPTSLFICGGLLIWAVDFLVIYIVAAVACAKGFAALRIAGLPLVAFVAAVLTALACAGTALLVRIAVHRLRADGQSDRAVRFIYFLAASIGALALIAILFNALPALLLATQC